MTPMTGEKDQTATAVADTAMGAEGEGESA